MTDYVSNPPSAKALMTSARSFGNYDLAAALADLIDNSIKAQASVVHIVARYGGDSPSVELVDDGVGMTRAELHAAMRPASADPDAERSPDDLGRFGWGMKSASFSQCKNLTVISKAAGEQITGARWDLDNIDDWQMAVLDSRACEALVSELAPIVDHGTSVKWANCDRLSEDGNLTETRFNELISEAANELSLIFHRYLTGRAKGRQAIEIRLNGNPIEAHDPFVENHPATQALEVEEMVFASGSVIVKPFVLPHFTKLTTVELERLGGQSGFIRNQGFYVYRNDRLIIHGTWFGLFKYGELSQLVRVSVDIPNTMDSWWKITVDKSDAQLPSALKSRLKSLMVRIKGRSVRVYRGRGGRIDRGDVESVWSRYARNGEIRYRINREHPSISSLLDGDAAEDARAALDLVEKFFPVSAFAADALERPQDIAQMFTSREEIIDQLQCAAPRLLADCAGDFRELRAVLAVTEPFCTHMTVVDDWLEEKKWI